MIITGLKHVSCASAGAVPADTDDGEGHGGVWGGGQLQVIYILLSLLQATAGVLIIMSLMFSHKNRCGLLTGDAACAVGSSFLCFTGPHARA